MTMVAVGLISLLLAAPTHASGTSSPADDRAAQEVVRPALDRIAQGTWTQEDINLLKLYPEIARQVPDPRDEGVVGTAVHRSADVGVAACWWAHVWVDKKDIFGSRIYRFNSRTDWCGSGGRVTSINRHDGWLSNQTWGIYFAGWEVDSNGILGSGNGYHDKRAAVDYCLPDIGCYTQTHPWINVDLLENLNPGAYGYTYSAG